MGHSVVSEACMQKGSVGDGQGEMVPRGGEKLPVKFPQYLLDLILSPPPNTNIILSGDILGS